MTQLKTAAAIVALATVLAACNNPQSAPEPQNEGIAEAMPDTPDRSETAADEAAAGMTGAAPAGGEAAQQPAAPPAG